MFDPNENVLATQKTMRPCSRGEQGLDAVRLGHVDLVPAVRAALDALVEATVQLR